MVVMYQSMKELRAAPGRAALITVTVGMIAVMVTFLSALAAGLSNQSVSAINSLFDGRDSDVAIIADGAASLTSSSIDSELQQKAENWAEQHDAKTRPLFVSRVRVGEAPATVLSDPNLKDNEIRVSDDGVAGKNLDPVVGQAMTLSGAAGPIDAKVIEDLPNTWLDHQPVIYASEDLIKQIDGRATAPAALIAMPNHPVPQSLFGGTDSAANLADASLPGAKVLAGKDRNNLSAAYAGEQTSLGAMTSMLYVISALVVGAFFTVWTVQRMRGVAISSALGASRRVLLADSLAQALAVLLIGIGGGIALTAAVGMWLSNAHVMDVVISPQTTILPGLILGATGVVGAVLALIPVFRVDPTAALANA